MPPEDSNYSAKELIPETAFREAAITICQAVIEKYGFNNFAEAKGFLEGVAYVVSALITQPETAMSFIKNHLGENFADIKLQVLLRMAPQVNLWMEEASIMLTRDIAKEIAGRDSGNEIARRMARRQT